MLTLQSGRLESAPDEGFQEVAHLLPSCCGPRLQSLALVARKIGGEQPVDLDVRHQVAEPSEAAL